MSLAKIITFSRAGTDSEDYAKGINFLKDIGASIYNVDRKISDISSSMVRDALADGKDLNDLLSDRVLEYIIENKLYGVNNDR